MSLRTIAMLVSALVLGTGALVALGGLSAVGVAGIGPAALSADQVPSIQARTEIPSSYLQAFQSAAAICPGLSWTVLAGIGRVETNFGADDRISSAGAEGPMQFMPSTFGAYARPVPLGGATPPTPFDLLDAAYAAARMLCADGARNGANVAGAIYAYNHTEDYVQEVLGYAAQYGTSSGGTSSGGTSSALDTTGVALSAQAVIAISYALAQIGTPYRWGGETPGVGFDCSGLTQAAYAAAGVRIPRTSTAQWTALPHVPLAQMQPGDLVFFEPGEFSPGLPGHVGIYLGGGEMVDAPHTGTSVQIDKLAGWPPPMGAARPTAAA
jgi:cell wall-associated NlpC family hydrolase